MPTQTIMSLHAMLFASLMETEGHDFFFTGNKIDQLVFCYIGNLVLILADNATLDIGSVIEWLISLDILTSQVQVKIRSVYPHHGRDGLFRNCALEDTINFTLDIMITLGGNRAFCTYSSGQMIHLCRMRSFERSC